MVEAVYTVTEDEFVEAQKLWCPQVARRVPGYWLMQLTGVAFGACVGISIVRLPANLALPLALSLLLYFSVVQWRKRAARKYQYNVKRTAREEISVRFDDAGYHDEKDRCCGGWIAWEGFTGWRETPTIFVIGRATTFMTVPKRPFSAEQQKELREMFRGRIRENI